MRGRRVHGERLSIPYFPGVGATDPSDAIQGRAFLFVRDLPLGIVPLRTHEAEGFDVELEPASREAADWLARLLVTRNHQFGLGDALCDFIHELVGSLAYSGEMLFEIVSSASDSGEQRLPAVELAPLPRGRVFRIGGRYVQLVPDYARGELGKRYVVIPGDRIWRLRFPSELGSPHDHRRLLRNLRSISDITPAFAMGPAMGSDVPGYDFPTFRLMADAEVEHLTGRWGSIPSLQRIDGTTEFYFFAQMLRFRRAQALVREQIVKDINVLLDRLGVGSVLSIKGLPTSDQIARLARDLQSGSIDFARAAERSDVP